MHSALPKPKPKPKAVRLPVEKGVTIGIGIVASDGIVIAADREEGDSYLKNDTGKISLLFKATQPLGSIAVTGAGTEPYIDEAAKLISASFSDDTEGTEATVESAIAATHRKYYSETVLPFALYPSNERPDYSLLVGCWGDNLGKHIWKTFGLSVSQSKDYDAVGAGSTVANALLGKLWDMVPVRYAIKLAAYVIYQVKASVKDCGFETDIAIVRQRSILEGVSSGAVRNWESVFRSYSRMERNAFYYCIGLETEQTRLYRTQLGKDSLTKELDELREALTRLDAQTSRGQR